MFNWIKKKLGITLLEKRCTRLEARVLDLESRIKETTLIGSDLHFEGDSVIVVASKLNGGQLRFIKAYFRSVRDMELMVGGLEERYKPTCFVPDVPIHAREIMRMRMRRGRGR